ncbi:MAG: hypothetical protein PHI42_06250 [Paludibacteraceae bacterium]|nr:hypothetical protein [Paludibacteraceae bacterium]
MDKTKTAVILGIVSVVLLGAILYALKDSFSSKNETTNKSTEKVAE